MVKFTAGVLRSNIHRVVNPPGAQADETRMSLVYFARPEDAVILQTLEGSDIIDERRKRQVGSTSRIRGVPCLESLADAAVGRVRWRRTYHCEGMDLAKVSISDDNFFFRRR